MLLEILFALTLIALTLKLYNFMFEILHITIDKVGLFCIVIVSSLQRKIKKIKRKFFPANPIEKVISLYICIEF
jgi:hypothetical protein